jgi:hypothetical protein
MISTNAIQLQFWLNQVLSSAKFRPNTITIESRPQGIKRKLEVLFGVLVMFLFFIYNRKVENIGDKIKKDGLLSGNDFLQIKTRDDTQVQ